MHHIQKTTLAILLFLITNGTVFAQHSYEQSLVILAHDHRFSENNYDGKNDFTEMIKAGVTAKVICVVTDIQDWKGGKVVRIENDSTLEANFGYKTWQSFYEGRSQKLIEISKSPNSNILIIKNTKDLISCKKSKTAGIIMGTEGVRFLNGSTEKLGQYHNQGLRHLQLYREPITIGAAIEEQGVTSFGKNLIENCNKLGIALDVTHVERLKNGNEILNEIVRLSSKPLIFSHQHSKIHGGNLTDEQIIAVAKSGGNRGIIGIHLINNYVKPAEFNTLISIIKHIKDLVGIEHVAIGGDYSPTSTYTWVVKDITDLHTLGEAMAANGFTVEEVEKVLGKNLMKFYAYTWNEM